MCVLPETKTRQAATNTENKMQLCILATNDEF